MCRVIIAVLTKSPQDDVVENGSISTMNAVITAAANQARQKPVKLSHNQEVSACLILCSRLSSGWGAQMCVTKIDGIFLLLAKKKIYTARCCFGLQSTLWQCHRC